MDVCGWRIASLRASSLWMPMKWLALWLQVNLPFALMPFAGLHNEELAYLDREGRFFVNVSTPEAFIKITLTLGHV